jgi:hypothetical protein
MDLNNLENSTDITQAKFLHQALRMMGANFSVSTENLQTAGGSKMPAAMGMAVVRDDTKAVVGNVTSRYKPVQTSALLEPVTALTRSTKGTDHELRPHRGAVLADGGKVVFQLDMGNERVIGDREVGDTVRARVTVIVKHDGSGSSRAQIDIERLACKNGMCVTSGAGYIAVPHIGDTKAYLERWTVAFAELRDQWARSFTTFNHMTSRRLPQARLSLRDLIRLYTAAVFGRDEMERQRDATAAQTETPLVASLIEAYEHGQGSDLPTTEGTAWGLYQALTHHLTHSRKITERRWTALTEGEPFRHNRAGIEVAWAMSGRAWTPEEVLDPSSRLLVDARAELARQ